MKPDGELKDEQLKLFHIRNEIEKMTINMERKRSIRKQ